MIEKITLGERYRAIPMLDIGEENSTVTFCQNIITQIIKKEDEAIKESIVKCAAEFCEENKKCLNLILIDEDTIKLIIELGLDCYTKQKQKLSDLSV